MKVTFVHSSSGDWVGMFLDDTLIEEGHSLRPETVADHLRRAGQVISKVDSYEAEPWLEDEGCLPDSLKEIQTKDKKWRKKNKASSSSG